MNLNQLTQPHPTRGIPMTKLDALRYIISRFFTLNAHIVHCEYDPAGSTQYEPDPLHLEILQALVGRELQDDDLDFCCGGLRGAYFSIRPALLLEITLTADSAASQ